MDQHQLGLFQQPLRLLPLRFGQSSRPNQCRRILLKTYRLIRCPSAEAQMIRRQKQDSARPMCMGPLHRPHSLIPPQPRPPHLAVARSHSRLASARSQSSPQSQQMKRLTQLKSRSRSPRRRLARRQALVNLDSVNRHLASLRSARRVLAHQCLRRL